MARKVRKRGDGSRASKMKYTTRNHTDVLKSIRKTPDKSRDFQFMVTTPPYITTELGGSYAFYRYLVAGLPAGFIVTALVVGK